MAIWNFMAGRRGLHEDYVLSNGRVHMNFNLDRSAFWFDRKHDLRDYQIEHKWPDQRIPQRTAAQDAGNLWRLSRESQLGDIVVLRMRPTTAHIIAVGEIVGDYVFDPEMSSGENQPGPHHREVEWVVTDLPFEWCGFGPNWQLPSARQTFSRIFRDEEDADVRILTAANNWQ